MFFEIDFLRLRCGVCHWVLACKSTLCTLPLTFLFASHPIRPQGFDCLTLETLDHQQARGGLPPPPPPPRCMMAWPWFHIRRASHVSHAGQNQAFLRSRRIGRRRSFHENRREGTDSQTRNTSISLREIKLFRQSGLSTARREQIFADLYTAPRLGKQSSQLDLTYLYESSFAFVWHLPTRFTSPE